MIEVRDLTKRYGSLVAVDGATFTVATGQAVGFLGPNGAGKTTTMRIITGFMPATSGTVRVDGFDVFSDSFEVRKRIGYLPETPPLYLEMRIRSYLRYVATLKGVARSRIAGAADRVIDQCGLSEVANRLCGNMSKGYRQRIGLAQALIHDPSVLVLDEPTIGLDPAQIVEIRGLIRNLAEKRTVVLSTHILPEVAQICSKVVIINQGKVALEQELSELTKDHSLEEEYMAYVSGEDCAAKTSKTEATDA